MLNRPIPKSTKLGVLGTIVIVGVAAVLLPMAKAHKANIAGAVTKPTRNMTLQRVRENWGGYASISLDGKYLCDGYWDTGDLAIRDLATDKVRRLTNKASWMESLDFASSSVISPDSRKVA